MTKAMPASLPEQHGGSLALSPLLANMFDYAGMFPPASLSLDEAARKFLQHRHDPHAWMLGRFVCPAQQLDALAPLVKTDDASFTLAVLLAGGDTVDEFLPRLDADMAAIERFPRHELIESLETRVPASIALDYLQVQTLLHSTVARVLKANLVPLPMYFELPISDDHVLDPRGRAAWSRVAAVLAEHNRTAVGNDFPAGVKLRAGGIEPAAVPSAAQVAAAICLARDAGVFWKATAGLHHPLRHFDEALGAPMHGFLNLAVAAVLADVHGLTETQLRDLLEDEDAAHFGFRDDELDWRHLSASHEQVAAARRRSLVSMGSCSFEEPTRDLQSQGWLPDAS
jgi:hypothetical protein